MLLLTLRAKIEIIDLKLVWLKVRGPAFVTNRISFNLVLKDNTPSKVGVTKFAEVQKV